MTYPPPPESVGERIARGIDSRTKTEGQIAWEIDEALKEERRAAIAAAVKVAQASWEQDLRDGLNAAPEIEKLKGE